MYVDIMYEKICKTISGNTESNPNGDIISIHHAKHYTEPGRNGINEKKHIVTFKKAGFLYMMICMKIPHESMHYESVRSPGHEFHDNKRRN